MLLVLGALELSDKVQTYGAYAGFASVLGLAVLSLLYFGQARELRRLREWAGRAPERAAELQERAAAEADKRVVAQPVRPPAATTAAGTAAAAPGAAAPGAAAPAGGPAPAIPAVPAAKPGAPGALAVPPSTAAGAAAASAPAGTPGAPSAPAGATPGGPPVPGTPAAPGVPPAGAPAAPGAGTDQPTVVARPTPSTPAPTGGGTSELKLPAASMAGAASTQDSGETAVPLRRVSAAATLPPRPGADRGGPGGPGGPGRDGGGGRGDRNLPPLAIIGGIVAVLVVGLLVATQLLGGGDDEPVRPNAITTAPAAAPDTPREQTTTTDEPEVSRGSVSVAVLNGTTITGLARGAANKIEATGYRIAKVGDNSVQTVQTSSVQFVDGSRRAAEDVARIVGIPTAALAPMDQGTRVVAGEDAAVVVIVGADQSQ